MAPPRRAAHRHERLRESRPRHRAGHAGDERFEHGFAIVAGESAETPIHAELSAVIAGRIPGRTSTDEVIVFDRTGTALQDVAAAAIVYERALREGRGRKIDFAS